MPLKTVNFNTDGLIYLPVGSFHTDDLKNVQMDSIYEGKNPDLGIIGLECLGASVGGITLGAVCGFLVVLAVPFSHPTSFLGIFVMGPVVGIPLGSSGGTFLTGKLLKQKGSFTHSLLWTIGGTIGSIGIAYAFGPDTQGYEDYLIASSFLTLPVTGAVIGYNLRGKTCCGIGDKYLNGRQNICSKYSNNNTKNFGVKVELVRVNF